MKENLYHGCPNLKDIMAYSDDKKRFMFHTGKLSNFNTVDCAIDLTAKTWFAVSSYSFGFQTKLYYRKTATKGFTFEKNKLHIWFKDHISKILVLPELKQFLHKMNLDWFSEIAYNRSYHNMITKTIFERVLNKKITNVKELIEYWFKYSVKDKTLDADLVIAAINSDNFNSMEFKWNSKVFNDKNEYLRHLVLGEKNLYKMNSLVNLAYILNEKLDCLFDDQEIKDKFKELSDKAEVKAKELGIEFSLNPFF